MLHSSSFNAGRFLYFFKKKKKKTEKKFKLFFIIIILPFFDKYILNKILVI